MTITSLLSKRYDQLNSEGKFNFTLANCKNRPQLEIMGSQGANLMKKLAIISCLILLGSPVFAAKGQGPKAQARKACKAEMPSASKAELKKCVMGKLKK